MIIFGLKEEMQLVDGNNVAYHESIGWGNTLSVIQTIQVMLQQMDDWFWTTAPTSINIYSIKNR
jgi:hypothetical protein